MSDRVSKLSGAVERGVDGEPDRQMELDSKLDRAAGRLQAAGLRRNGLRTVLAWGLEDCPGRLAEQLGGPGIRIGSRSAGRQWFLAAKREEASGGGWR